MSSQQHSIGVQTTVQTSTAVLDADKQTTLKSTTMLLLPSLPFAVCYFSRYILTSCAIVRSMLVMTSH